MGDFADTVTKVDHCWEAAAGDISQHADHMPVRTERSETWYDRRVWYEVISSLRTVNGVAMEDMETPLDKSNLKQGSKVTLDFDGKVFSGVIDFECFSPSESLQREPVKHLESPSKTSGVGSVKQSPVSRRWKKFC